MFTLRDDAYACLLFSTPYFIQCCKRFQLDASRGTLPADEDDYQVSPLISRTPSLFSSKAESYCTVSRPMSSSCCWLSPCALLPIRVFGFFSPRYSCLFSRSQILTLLRLQYSWKRKFTTLLSQIQMTQSATISFSRSRRVLTAEIAGSRNYT